MINQQLLSPKSIVVVGASDQIQKPGGKILSNLLAGGYSHPVYVVNPNAKVIQGISCHSRVDDLPGSIDLAILAIPAKFCVEAVEALAYQKGTKAFIIISAGFGEESREGALIEQRIVAVVNEVKGALIGPNCIGMMTPEHHSVFTEPIPPLMTGGIDFVTGSGATAVFILESAKSKGLTFNSVFSVGNSAQMGVEEVLQYMDETYIEGISSPVKLLYMESVRHPDLLLRHATSLTRKGCRIAAIKAGQSEAGSRAASSHTGALAGNDKAVDALFRKAGIIRCFGREELVNVAAILSLPVLKGNRLAIVTHAGGPAVMLTDALAQGAIQVPPIEGDKAKALLGKLYDGSSVGNPIDFLATGTADQLGHIIDAVNHDFDHIDGMAVIFGSPGLMSARDAYAVLHEKMMDSPKPIFPILPSVVNVKEDIEFFINKGHVCFNDEVLMAQALCKVFNNKLVGESDDAPPLIDQKAIRSIIDGCPQGYLSPEMVQQLFDATGLPRVKEYVVKSEDALIEAVQQTGYPVVLKVVGPVHKTDVGGVALNINDQETLMREFHRMLQIPEANAVLIQPMLKGYELFVGASMEPGYGHLVMFGLGGIFIEVLKDVSVALAPLSASEARSMVVGIKGYDIIKGVRGQKGIDQHKIESVLVRLSAMLAAAPEIAEMDINPLLGNEHGIVAVDARIRIAR